MSVEDFRDLDLSTIDADVCLVGSGPAAYAIASQLRTSRLRIVILESGGLEMDADSRELNDFDDVGVPLEHGGRERGLGGTSQTWSGRSIAFDDVDFEARSWVPFSGWPVGRETIAPYLNTAAAYLGADPYHPDGRQWSPEGLTRLPAFESGVLTGTGWHVADPLRVAPFLREAKNVRVIVNATVTHIDVDAESGHVTSVEIASSLERRARVTARAIVVCAGGIENARILLTSNRVVANGLGNGHDLVGRFLMDHPRDRSMLVRFDVRDAAQLRGLFGPFNADNAHGRCDYFRGLALGAETQRRQGLLNCAALPTLDVAMDDPIDAARRIAFGDRDAIVRDAAVVARQPLRLLGGLGESLSMRRRVGRKLDRIGFVVVSEQVPDADSRITLSHRTDRFGTPLAAADWRIHDIEAASQAYLANAIAAEFARLGLPAATLADWVRKEAFDRAPFVDGCHPTGTTRMAADARHGVVDADCQVYGTRGLYVAGSSIFPTAGHANPTLMIVAFAIRLAHHLEERFARSVPIARTALPNVSPVEPLRAALTGASGFIGGRLAEKLVREGTPVVSLQRPASRTTWLESPHARTIPLDLTDREATRAALRDVDVVFHCAYDWIDEAWNFRALDSLIDACSESACRLVFLSSFVVYDIPSEGSYDETCAATASGSGYAAVKSELEGMLMRAARERPLSFVILQPTIVYGPSSKPWTIDPAEALRRATVVLPDDGEGLCNAVYVDDVVAAMLLAARSSEAQGRRFLVSGPQPVAWREFYERIAAAAGASGPAFAPSDRISLQRTTLHRIGRLVEKLPVRRRIDYPDPGRMQFLRCRSAVDIDEARRVLGFVPAFDFAAGMIPTAQFLETRFAPAAV